MEIEITSNFHLDKDGTVKTRGEINNIQQDCWWTISGDTL